MNILVASNNLKTTGLGTFIYTQVSELVSRGHNVDIVTICNGKVGEMLSSHVIELDSVKKSYDLILTNQNDITSELIDRNVTGYVIFTVHGVAFDFNDCPKFPKKLKMKSPTTAAEDWKEAESLKLKFINPDFLRTKFMNDGLYNQLKELITRGINNEK